MKKGKPYFLLLTLLISLLFCVSNYGFAEKEVKIGVLLPLSGKLAIDGLYSKEGVDLAVDIINNKTDIDTPLGRDEGLPNLGGAKIKVVYADDQGLPERGQSEAERLIVSEGVAVLFGSFSSSTTLTAQLVAERYKVPLLNSLSTSPLLNEKGLKWFFRDSPDDRTYLRANFEFLKEYEQSTGKKFETIALLNEDSLWGTDCGKIILDYANEYGYKVVEQVSFPSGTIDLSSEVLKIKKAKPDILMEICYGQDQILLIKTIKNLDLNVDIIFSGVQYPALFEALKEDAEGIIFKETLSEDLTKTNKNAKKIMELWYEKFDHPMGDTARAINGIFVLADAINRAGSTDAESIRKALIETDIPSEKLFLPWEGVKFNSKGLNMKANGILVQNIEGKLHQIWPFESSTYKPVIPLKKME